QATAPEGRGPELEGRRYHSAADGTVTKSRQRAVPVIGYRSGGSAGAVLPPFRQGLHETGYIEGQIVIIEGQIVIILGLSFLDTLRRTEHVARGSLWKRFDVTAQ